MLFLQLVNGNPFCAAEYYRNSNCIATFSFQQAAAYSVKKKGALDVHFHSLPSESRYQPQYIFCHTAALLTSSQLQIVVVTNLIIKYLAGLQWTLSGAAVD